MPGESSRDADGTPYDMLPVGIIVVSSDYTVLSWNTCIADWTGLTADLMIGRNLKEQFRHLDAPRYSARIEQVFSGGPAVFFSPRFHPHLIPADFPSGEKRIQSTTVVPVADGDRFLAMFVIEDVTDLSRQVSAFRELKNVAVRELEERKKAEAKARHLASIVESSEDAIIGNTLDGIITSWNPGAERLYGYLAEEVVGHPLSILSPDDGDEPALGDRIRAGGAVSHHQTRRKTKDGRILDISLTVSPIRDENGAITGASTIARDITEARRMEEVVRLANRKLSLLNSITRHDILNQLMVLQAYIELMKDFQSEPGLCEYVLKTEQATENIRGLLEFMRSYQDIGVKSPAWQDLNLTVREAVTGLDLHGTILDIDLPHVEIFADPLLRRVFYNLVENAIRHGEKGTRIRFRFHGDHESGILVCEDDGAGVPADVKEQIFRREYYRHTGFGLYLSREILSITGITIRENGEPGRGARFEMVIPKGAYRDAEL